MPRAIFRVNLLTLFLRAIFIGNLRYIRMCKAEALARCISALRICTSGQLIKFSHRIILAKLPEDPVIEHAIYARITARPPIGS